MTIANAAWLDYQRRRFIRPDAHRYMRPDAARLMPHKAGLKRAQPAVDNAPTNAAAIKAEWTELLAPKALVTDLKFHLALRRFARKYREDQPRDDRGRWVYDGGRPNRMRLAAGEKPTLGPQAFAAIGVEVAKRAIEAYRKTNSLWDLFGGRIGTVATTTIGDQRIFGSNSTSPTYSSVDREAAINLRDVMLQKYPDVMNTEDIGQRPNDALFHAEATVLLRAARTNGGHLADKTFEVLTDRPLCPSCKAVLPYVGLELGNPTVTFVDSTSGVRQTIQSGKWAK